MKWHIVYSVEPWTVMPTNVTATPLSMTTALISWSIASNDETNTSHHNGETNSILHRLEITYKPLQERYLVTRFIYSNK